MFLWYFPIEFINSKLKYFISRAMCRWRCVESCHFVLNLISDQVEMHWHFEHNGKRMALFCVSWNKGSAVFNIYFFNFCGCIALINSNRQESPLTRTYGRTENAFDKWQCKEFRFNKFHFDKFLSLKNAVAIASAESTSKQFERRSENVLQENQLGMNNDLKMFLSSSFRFHYINLAFLQCAASHASIPYWTHTHTYRSSWSRFIF